jgi:hypothetical protein
MLCISYVDLYYVLYNNISYYDDVLAVELAILWQFWLNCRVFSTSDEDL